MLDKILEILTPTVHREKKFVIKKESDTLYCVKAKSGLYANMRIDNTTLFVNVFSASEELVTRYCVDITDQITSIDQFVIEHSQNNVLFNIDKYSIDGVIRNNYDIFRDVNFILSTEDYRKIYDYDPTQLLKLESELFDKIYYPYIFFSRKNVVKNIHRFSFKAINYKGKITAISHYYMVGDVLLSLGNLKQYIDTVSVYDSGYSQHVPSKTSFGIDNQLFDDVLMYANHLNPTNILMLKRKQLNYCHIKKENKKLVISYLENFNEQTTGIKQTSKYIKIINLLFKIKQIDNVYENAYCVSIVWDKGNVKINRSTFNFEFAKKYEKAISTLVKNKFNDLRLTQPSPTILKSLADVGLPNSTPLSIDNLTVLDMIDI